MKDLHRLGGIAALYEAAAYVVGIFFFLFILDYASIVEPADQVALLVANQVSMYLATLFIYIIFGIFLIILALALYERLKTGAPAIMQVATAVGLIWAGAVIASGMVFNAGIGPVVALYATDPTQAASVWLAIESVSQGLGGGSGEILGGVWTLLVSWAALRTGAFPRALNYLGLAVGAAGIISTIPGLNDLGGMFGISQIVWFVWLGIILLRSRPETAAGKAVAIAA